MLNHAIRKVDLQLGRITTIAGTGEAGFSGDGGPANEAQLSRPHSIQFGPVGNLYIADIGNHRLRVIDMDTGIISTFAGTGKNGVSRDGESFATADLMDRELWISMPMEIFGWCCEMATKSTNPIWNRA